MELTYRIAKASDVEEVKSFLQTHFRVTEPITQAVGATVEDVEDFFRDLAKGGCDNELYSTLVYSDNDLVAVCLNDVKEIKDLEIGEIRPLNPYRDYSKEISAGPYRQHNANRLCAFVETVEEDLPRLLGLAHRVFKVDVICCRKDFMARGIARELMKRAEEAAMAANCECMATCATAVASQGLFAKLGFKIFRELPFSCFRENGEIVYQNLPDGGRSAKLMAKELENHEDLK